MPTRRYKMVNSKIVNEVVKFAYYSLLLVIASCLLASCDSNITNMGQSIRPEGDQIKVATDTFRLSTANVFVEKMYNRPDSLLLGTFKDDRYGTTYADILARFEAAFDRARRQGFGKVGLIVDVDKPKAEALYRRLGFTEAGIKDFFGHRMKHMQKDIL